jgi:hypothetical protein
MINSIRQEYEIRKNEIDEYYSIILSFDSGAKLVLRDNSERRVSSRIAIIAKANIILQLYNLVESTTTNLLNEIHDSIKTSNTNYSDLNNELKVLLITYYYLIHTKKNNIHHSASDIIKLIGLISENNSFDLVYSDMIKYYSLYSGNIDSKELCKIFNKYGVNLNIQYNELKKIKDERNKLAHGIVSFEECGRDLSLQYINTLKEKTYLCLDEVITKIEEYIVHECYKLQI